MRGEPGAAALEDGAQAQCVHAPADAAWRFERARDQLIESMDEQLLFADRREERERGNDRLGSNASLDRLRYAAGGELPQPAARRAELGSDRRLGQRGERAEGANAELAKTTVRVRVERENSDGLGSEKIPLLSCWYDDRFARLGAAGGHPSSEFSNSPTQSDGLTV